MVGKKTHEQQQRVLQGREDTSNASKDFDAEEKLQRSEALRKAYRKGDTLDTEHGDARDEDDRSMARGKNQEGRRHKGAES
ncbi:hypothetical protein [Sinorhizobium mexicanum]|uniref:Uncharacterized protein n=1 Tax=Sinorhizobium mexicanum TaxID=375549 RepID=A0A859QUU8_9HYPH|nr:hypothetical protein [Sinorhizobium mexicanum]MBP1883265.1 hypothetical protein [Sinorhizobium mexicanum]QLL62471.1 hypothetical protein FKV68_14005 [Sinorhizobium mexicanum]